MRESDCVRDAASLAIVLRLALLRQRHRISRSTSSKAAEETNINSLPQVCYFSAAIIFVCHLITGAKDESCVFIIALKIASIFVFWRKLRLIFCLPGRSVTVVGHFE